MKNYILITTIFALLLLGACKESFLDEKPQSFETDKNTYTSTAGFNAALNGMMAYVRLEYQTWNDGIIQQGACGYEILQVGTDICLVTAGDPSLIPFESYNESSFNGKNNYIKNKWNWAYGLIANANKMINYAENSTVKWSNANDKNYFQANARFMRAYAYRVLVYLWGDVPWITEITDVYRTDFERTPKAEVIKNMIIDLEFAAKYLPENPMDPNVKDGHLTRWAALHLLSEICIYAGDYKRAIEAATEVTTSPYFALTENRFGAHLNTPGDFYSDMFKENNHNYRSGNKESLWVIQAEYNVQGGGGKLNDWTRRAWVPAYYQIEGFKIANEYGGRGLGQIRPMDSFYSLLEDKDVRNSEYNIRRKWYYNNPAFPDKYGKLHEITSENIAKGHCFAAITKFDYGIESNPLYEGVSKDKTRFRLAETYLLLAEAYILYGKIPEATAAINEVRGRAGATLAEEYEVNIDYLLDERARELIGEEVRRFTLIRTGKLLERTRKYNPISGKTIQDKHVLWPIPQDIIDANSGKPWSNNWE